jgi:hypothetical protein
MAVLAWAQVQVRVPTGKSHKSNGICGGVDKKFPDSSSKWMAKTGAARADHIWISVECKTRIIPFWKRDAVTVTETPLLWDRIWRNK